jgi:ubiquinone/menaquinone biosynthesis C-methylase UbiE
MSVPIVPQNSLGVNHISVPPRPERFSRLGPLKLKLAPGECVSQPTFGRKPARSREASVDYDRIAPSYNQRFIDGGMQGTATALRRLAQGTGAGRILEVGCGTGHWLATLGPVSGQLYGLDLSAGMLAQAGGQQATLALVRGRAGQLPFPEGCFDLVYCVNALHHFQQQRAFVFEARRLLRRGGLLAVAGMDPRVHRNRWYVYDYFDGTYETDLARFPSWGRVLDWMVAAGFEGVESRWVERIVDPKRGRAVLDDPFLRKDSCSQLALLSDEAYAAGLDRIEAALSSAEAAGETILFATDLLLAMIVGRVP